MQATEMELPEALLPYKERLSPRFYEVWKAVLDFIGQGPLTPAEAKRRGIMNLFLPEVSKLSVLEYSPIAEILGMHPQANWAMNCSAPDTGNMEVLQKFGSPEQKRQWLDPLLNMEIRSAFAMTEPGVASSDATNIATRIDADGEDYVINGHKWWISGAIRQNCKVFVLLGKTSFTGPLHEQQSMILVPRDAPGVKIVRAMEVFGKRQDHAEIIFDNVRVPKSNLILGEGRGFEIAQGRLGPGRIHHCMRSIGQAEQALAAIVDRAYRRKAFGRMLAEKDAIRAAIAEARIEISKCRQLCYLAAVVADERGFKAAQAHVAMLKVAAPRMALRVIDEAIQIHGAHGVSQDSRLADMWIHMRTLRVADGPDAVHMMTIAKNELAQGGGAIGRLVSGTNPNVEKYGKFSHVEGGALYIRGSAPTAKL